MTRTVMALADDRHRELQRATAQSRMRRIVRQAARPQPNPEPATSLLAAAVWVTAVSARRQPT